MRGGILLRFIAIVFLVLLSFCKSCFAVAIADNDTIKEAQNYGQKQSTSQQTNFSLPWTSYEESAQKIDAKTEYAYIYTPYHLIAADARDKTLERQQITLTDSKKLLEQYAGYLTFSVNLFGTDENLGKDIQCILKTETGNIRPQYSTASVIQKTSWFPQRPFFKAMQYYYFIQEQITITKPITLIIITADNQEHRFNFDLGKIK